jgi:hypothetical protein
MEQNVTDFRGNDAVNDLCYFFPSADDESELSNTRSGPGTAPAGPDDPDAAADRRAKKKIQNRIAQRTYSMCFGTKRRQDADVLWQEAESNSVSSICNDKSKACRPKPGNSTARIPVPTDKGRALPPLSPRYTTPSLQSPMSPPGHLPDPTSQSQRLL